MEKSEKVLLERKKAIIRRYFKKISEHREKILFFTLLAFSVIFKLYYFFKTMDQAVWWDEGDYLAISKEFLVNRELPEWWAHFTGMRPLLMPLIWSFTFLLNLPEPAIRFITLLIPSILTILLTYKIGKDLYNYKVGLMSGAMLSVYWVHHFYTFRFLTDIPAMFFGVLSIYFFWSKYIKENKSWGLHLSAVTGVLAFATRFPLALVLFSIYLFLFITRGSKIFKNKTILKSISWGFLTFLPYLIYFIMNNFQVFDFYFGDQAVSMSTPIKEAYHQIIPMVPGLMHSIWFATAIVGIATLYKLFIGFDLIIKGKAKELHADLFLLLIALINIIFYVVIIKAANDRWLLMFILPIFILSAKGIDTLGDLAKKLIDSIGGKIKKYRSLITTVIILLLLFGGMYQHISHGKDLTLSKVNTYQEEKLGGLWLKENTPKDSKIIISSIVQNQYYSERQSYDFYSHDKILDYCYDIYGRVVETEECQTKTEKAFREKVKKINADYMVLHVFEPVFTPQWAYEYPLKHQGELEPIQGYLDANNNPILIIYKFNKSSEVFT